MLAAAKKMISNPYGWLWLHGGPGNAKSVVLMALVNELNAAGRGPAMYVTFTGLVNWIREAFGKNPDETYVQKMEKILHTRVLAIDEMDKAKTTEWLEEFRFHFLDERYRQGVNGDTVTIFASNSNPDELPMALYDRVRDGRFMIVENTAPSARPKMAALGER